jgi:TonB-dependent receptor
MHKSSVFKARWLGFFLVSAGLASPMAVTAEEEIMEEVIVYGIKSSLLDAIDIKRSNVGVMDAISAEDFGKFPDGNLAESLARVSGVAIDRSNVEGQAIAVRGFGPEFNLVTLNGRQMPTVAGKDGGGRSFNFGDIASPGVSAVEIYKSGNSALPSGGIGSTVNMVTTKPLMVDGTKQSYSIGLVEDTTSEDGGTPVEAALLYATNQERWGFSLSASYQERSNREEGTQESNWLSPARFAGRIPATADITDNNRRPDGSTFFQEPVGYLIKDNDRERINAQATYQLMFSDSVTATVDYTMSGVDFASEGTTFGSWLGGWTTSAATIAPSGAYTDSVVSGRGYDHSVTWGELESDNRSVGLNLVWDVSENLQLELDAHDSSAELAGNIYDNRLGFSTDINTANITTTNGGANGISTFSYDVDFGPENMVGSSLSLNDQFQQNEISQIQIKGTWFTDGDGALKSIDFGVSTAKSEFVRQSRGSNFGIDVNGEALEGFEPQAADWDDALFVRTPLGNFMNSFNPNLGTDYYFEIDARAAAAAFAAINPTSVDSTDIPAATGATYEPTACCDSLGPLDSDEYVREDMDSAYIQLNFESEMLGRPLNTVAGLRYEKTDSQSTSNYATPTNLRWEYRAGLQSYSEGVNPETDYGDSSLLLPSLAMALAIDDNKVLRMSFSKSLSRPSLKDLETQLEIGGTDLFSPTATGGNPNLQPLESKNFDIAFENYYAEGSYVALNYFRKKIKNFISSATREQQPIGDLRNPVFSANGLIAQECVREWVADGRPEFIGWPNPPDWAAGWGSNAGVNGGNGYCLAQNAIWDHSYLSDEGQMGWVMSALEAGIDVSKGIGGDTCATYYMCANSVGGYFVDGKASDPVALFDITQPANLERGTVSGLEFSLQHLFEGTPFGIQANYTYVIGGDVEPDNYEIGDQFILPGFGNSGNLSGWFENEKHTLRLALNYRGETAQGFANYKQPVYVDSRYQVDVSYQYRYNDNVTVFLDAQNVTDEGTRLWVRSPEMLFLSQDHGPVYKLGVRANF